MKKFLFFFALVSASAYAAQAPEVQQEVGWRINGTFALCQMKIWNNQIGITATKANGAELFYPPGAILLQISKNSALTLCAFMHSAQQNKETEKSHQAKRLFFKNKERQAGESVEEYVRNNFDYFQIFNVENFDGSPRCVLFTGRQ